MFIILKEFLNITKLHGKTTGSPQIYSYTDLHKKKMYVPNSKIPFDLFYKYIIWSSINVYLCIIQPTIMLGYI